jgi:hypothetical protein
MIKRIARRTRSFFTRPVMDQLATAIPEERYENPNPASQIQLVMTYRRMLHDRMPLPSFRDVGFKAYSQTDEDGILLYIFSLIGMGSRRCVELCAGDGLENNTANLVINHGWRALWIDGNQRLVERGRAYYARSRHTFIEPPIFEQQWIKRDTINGLLARHGFDHDVDFLSLDMDGVDYWILEALTIRPRVIVLEHNSIMGHRACTVPYKDDFNCEDYTTAPRQHGHSMFMGASLPAFSKLLDTRNYDLIGTNRLPFNAFFIRRDVNPGLFEAMDWRQVVPANPDPRAEHLPWVDV